MRILYLASRFPYPPNRGDRLTGYHFLRTMSRRHAVTLVSFVDGGEPPDARQALAPWCERIETVSLPKARSWAQAWLALLSTTPSQVAYYGSAAMRELVNRLVREQKFDVVFVQLVRLAPAARDLDHPVKVLFFPDLFGLNLRKALRFAPWWRAPGVWWEAARMERFEIASTASFRESWLLSPEEVRTLQGLGGQRVALIRHGVDETLFDLQRGSAPGPVAVFLGNLSVPHNIDAARFAATEVWPRVRKLIPGATLRLVGADAVPSVTRLDGEPGVEVAGFVPDLAAVWRDAAVMLAPLRYSTGIQNKVLEAMAAGVPVVTTPPVASAIGAEAGVHLRTGDTADALAQAVAATLADPQGAAGQAARAREYVRANFTWEESVRRLESLAGLPAFTSPESSA